MTPTPTATFRPEPTVVYEMPARRFHKLRRAIGQGLAAYHASRNKRLARAAFEASEHAKMDRFLRNCALNNRIETSGW